MSSEKQSISVHAARTALNRDPQLRQWAEQWLKSRERIDFMLTPGATEGDFEKHWPYVRPERMHDGAVAAVTAFYEQQKG